MQKTKTGNGGGLMDLVSKQPHLTKFNKAIESAGLTEKFLGPANYTVFAPTDEAFNKLSMRWVILRSLPTRNAKELSRGLRPVAAFALLNSTDP